MALPSYACDFYASRRTIDVACATVKLGEGDRSGSELGADASVAVGWEMQKDRSHVLQLAWKTLALEH